MQLEIVHPALHGHDPAVEQAGGGHQLAAEVVDDEAAAQGLNVERRLVEIGGGVEAQVQHLQGQFAAGDDEGPATGDPAGIDLLQADEGGGAALGGLPQVQPLVHARVIDAHDLAADHDGVGDIDNVVEDVGQAEGHRGLAVAGGAVHEDGAVRVQGRADLLDEDRVDRQVAERGTDLLRGDDHVVDLLQLDQFDEGL